jgi:hypothetical protein
MAAGQSRIRWDRVGRTALLLVLAGVLYLYVGPTRNWVSTYKESKSRKAEVAELKHQNRELVSRRNYLQAPGTAETEARRLGMVRGAEKSYVIQGLPNR